MTKLITAALWFYAGWAFGSMIAWALGLSIGLGPTVAVAAAATVLRVPQLTAVRPANA